MAQKVNLDIAQTLNITCRRGDTFSLDITLKDSSGAALQLDRDDYEFIMQVRTSAFADGKDGIILSTPAHVPSGATSGSGFIGFIEAMSGVDVPATNVTDEGVVSIKISDSTMRDMRSGRYTYDLQYIAKSVHTTILTGSFVVNEDVSEFTTIIKPI